MKLHFQLMLLPRRQLFFSWILLSIAIILTSTKAMAQTPVVWTDLVNVTVQPDNSLLRVSSGGYGTTGAASQQKLFGDGSISFDMPNWALGEKHHYVIGLSESNSDAHYRSIDYGIVVYSPNKVILVYENNNLRKSRIGYSFFVPGKTFTIERQGSTISYFHDGSLIHENKSAFTGELLVDVTMGPQGDMIPNVMITGAGGSNTPPEITDVSNAATTATVDTLYSYTVEATDADGDTVTFTVPTKPAWLSFDDIDTLSGTPTNADVSEHLVEIEATDAGGATVTQTFTITVSAASTPPGPNGDQTFDGTVTIQDVNGSGNPTDLEVYGISNLGPVVLDVAGGGVGSVDDATYESAPFLLKHDIDGDGSTALNIALDGNHLSTDAQPFVIQNTNPAGGITFQTGANATDRLTIAADGSVTIQGVTITNNNGSSVVTIPGAINASSVELPDGTTISELNDLGNPDQTLSINGDQLTISGVGGNTVTLPSVTNGLSAYEIWLQDGNTGTVSDFLVSLIGPAGADGASPFVLNASGVHFTSGNVGIGTDTPSETLDVSGNVRVDGAVTVVTPAGDIPTITY